MVAMKPHIDALPTIADLEQLSLPELRKLYTHHLRTQPPPRASLDFLKGTLAWHLQALACKQDPYVLRQQLLNAARKTTPGTTRTYKPGTRLIREWQGTTYEVTVVDAGYQWQGQHYRSLSSIARDITGTRWSGPRFFGLL